MTNIMFDMNSNAGCSLSDKVLAYLYRELAASERLDFEDHLGECGICIDELAELSFAHLDVYEWRRDVFDPLPTPSFTGFLAASEATRPSWWRQFTEAVSAFVSPQWAAGGAFAAIALVAAAFYSTQLIVPSGEIAADQPATVQPKIATLPNSLPVAEPITDAKETASLEPKKVESPRPIRIVEQNEMPSRRSIQAVNRNTNKRPNTETARNLTAVQKQLLATAPRLNDFKEETDTTLRLADLFADANIKD